MSDEVESSIPVNLAYIILGFGTYFFPVNVLSKQKHDMHHRMRDPLGLKVIHYAAHLVDLNDYLAMFHGENISDKNCVTELNENLLNGMPNSCIKQLYLQVFYC